MTKEEIINKAMAYLVGENIISVKSSQKDIASKMGANYKNVNSALNGNENYLTDGFLRKFNNAFDNIFNLDWLLTGEGQMLKSKSNSNSISNIGDNNMNAIGGRNVVANQHTEKKIEELERIIEEKELKIIELQKTIADKDAMIDNFKYVIELLKK